MVYGSCKTCSFWDPFITYIEHYGEKRLKQSAPESPNSKEAHDDDHSTTKPFNLHTN
ncbi:hypothetical protein HanRHA438_Chr15g0728211 [Helianthus annuus]|nr:hypothetical protein HanRHA438_Chr15g0728211 [Helianthus annuus]